MYCANRLRCPSIQLYLGSSGSTAMGAGGQTGQSRRFWIPQLPTFHSSRADLTENSSSNFNSLASRQVERIKQPINLWIQITKKKCMWIILENKLLDLLAL